MVREQDRAEVPAGDILVAATAHLRDSTARLSFSFPDITITQYRGRGA